MATNKCCLATEKSEDIACARRCRSSRLKQGGGHKKNKRKKEGLGGGEAQEVADPEKNVWGALVYKCKRICKIGPGEMLG
jgi:hypothetical protein